MREDMAIVNLAPIRAAPRRHSGKLDMAGDVEIGAQSAGQVAFQNLNVIAVEHQPQVRRAHSFDDPPRLVGMVQEISRRVMMVQRLDQEGDIRRHAGGVAKILDETGLGPHALGKAGHGMDVRCGDGPGIGDRQVNCRPCLILASRYRGQPVIPASHIAAQRVQPQHDKAGRIECRFHICRVMVIGPMAFDSVKSGCVRRMDGLDQRTVSPQKPQIGRKLRHSSHSMSKPVTYHAACLLCSLP